MKANKKLGQFFTDKKIANIMVKWVTQNSPETLLDPAVGAGVFLKAADKKIKKYACEIDDNIIKNFALYNMDWELFENDYLLQNFPFKFDAVVCNPPYNKFQQIKNRSEYIKILKEKYNVSLSGYSNLCVYFLIKSINELNTNGRCCYLVPYEFLNTGYGEKIKEYFLKTGVVDTILKFNSGLKLFDDAITTSCILFIENKKHKGINFLCIDSLNDIENFNLDKQKKTENNVFTDYQKLKSEEKWLKYFFDYKSNNIYFNQSNDDFVPFSAIAQVKRGIATGNNHFFTLNSSLINQYHLSSEVCLPCICKSPDVSDLFFTSDTFNELLNKDKKIYLFNGANAVTNSDFNYIKYGEENNVDKSYLTSHRNPWFAIENKEPSPIWISVFSRNKLKIIRNKTSVKNLTTFHGIHFKKNVSEEMINMMFCYLITPAAQNMLYMNKREYGNGLDKFEPNDLNNAYIINLNKIKESEKKEILNIYSELQLNQNTEKYINELNNIFLSYIKF